MCYPSLIRAKTEYYPFNFHRQLDVQKHFEVTQFKIFENSGQDYIFQRKQIAFVLPRK